MWSGKKIMLKTEEQDGGRLSEDLGTSGQGRRCQKEVKRLRRSKEERRYCQGCEIRADQISNVQCNRKL